MGFFKPAWKRKNEAKALAAISLVIDQSELSLAAINVDVLESVRIVAVQKITDANVLLNLALHDKTDSIRITALNRITDQNILEQLVGDIAEPYLREQLIERIRNRDFLLKLSNNDSDDHIRGVAYKRYLRVCDDELEQHRHELMHISDENTLWEIAHTEKDFYTRLLIYENISEKAWIAHTVRNLLYGEHDEYKRDAAQKLIDLATHSPKDLLPIWDEIASYIQGKPTYTHLSSYIDEPELTIRSGGLGITFPPKPQKEGLE